MARWAANAANDKMQKRIEIFTPDDNESTGIPYSDNRVAAGFPSPAEHYSTIKLDLNKELIKNPAATFYARVKGVSMIDDGIDDGDLIVIDKSIEPYNGCLAVCYIDGEFTIKRFEKHSDHCLLVPANKDYRPIKITADNEFIIWGVVTYVIKKL